MLVIVIIAQVNLTGDARDPTEYLVQVRCMGGWTDEEYKALIGISAISFFLAFNAILGNTLILVALHNESVTYQPSKLLYRCLATTDLCSGVILEPVATVYRFSLIQEDWKLCRYAVTTCFMVGFPLFFSLSVYSYRHKCRQTSCFVTGAEVQTCCYFKANICLRDHHLGCGHSHRDFLLCESPSNHLA